MLQPSPITEIERQYNVVVNSMDYGAKLAAFKAAYAVIHLCDLGQVTQPLCALDSSYVKQDNSKYHTELLKYLQS